MELNLALEKGKPLSHSFVFVLFSSPSRSKQPPPSEGDGRREKYKGFINQTDLNVPMMHAGAEHRVER